MSLFGRKEKEEIARLREQMSPDQLAIADLSKQIEDATRELDKIQAESRKAQQKVADSKAELEKLRENIVETNDAILLQTFGFYTPHYYYTTSEEYKHALEEVRNSQKDMIRSERAVTGNSNWQVNGSASKGKKMVKDMQKLLLRAFNAECDDAVEHVTFSNIAACEKKIKNSSSAISKLGEMMGIEISAKYEHLKLEELRLMHEYKVKKQEEKEAIAEARARQREEAKILKEMEEAKKQLEKEQNHYCNALSKINLQISSASPEELSELQAKKAELESHLADIDHKISDVDYRAANQRAGYVYVISNIGAFGENVFKIGMTRRLDPMERVDELGDASVPFKFDVHAMIFCEDAPKLEAALHNAFADKKVNFVNQRREFFRVSLDEIKKVILENYDKTVEFVDTAPAEQYRESLKLANSQP